MRRFLIFSRNTFKKHPELELRNPETEKQKSYLLKCFIAVVQLYTSFHLTIYVKIDDVFNWINRWRNINQFDKKLGHSSINIFSLRKTRQLFGLDVYTLNSLKEADSASNFRIWCFVFDLLSPLQNFIFLSFYSSKWLK